MKKYLLILLVALMVASLAKAQKTCVIANAEDHVPIREALIHTDNNHWARTDYRGYWTMKYQFDSATVSKQGFLKTTIYLKNLPDTVFLLPESHQVKEVEVWGKGNENAKSVSGQGMAAAAEAGKLANMGKTQLARFDVEGLADGRARRDRRHLKKAQNVLDNLDKETGDPIENAYEAEMGRIREKSQSKKSKKSELKLPKKKDSEEDNENLKSEEQKSLHISVESSASFSK